MGILKFNLVAFDGGESLTLFGGPRPLVATDAHPYWDKIKAGVLADDPEVAKLFDMREEVKARFERLSERVSVVGNSVTFDGDVIDNSLTQQVIRFVEAGVEDWRPLVNFFEKVMLNPSEHSREQLFKWLDRNEFTITDAGDIVAYKGVYLSDKEGFDYMSVHAGTNTVTVDGVSSTGRVYQSVGSIVEMPRSEVDFNPSEGCSQGLHVSTFTFATTFAGGGMLKILVNPRDFVSVPEEGNWQKCRVCRYVVDSVVTEPMSEPVYNTGFYGADAVLDDEDEDSWDEDESWSYWNGDADEDDSYSW